MIVSCLFLLLLLRGAPAPVSDHLTAAIEFLCALNMSDPFARSELARRELAVAFSGFDSTNIGQQSFESQRLSTTNNTAIDCRIRGCRRIFGYIQKCRKGFGVT